MRKGLRSLLLKTHPDFFTALPAKRQENERSLALLNVLVDGAAGAPESIQFSEPVLRIRLHSRRDDSILDHAIVVPEWLQRGSRDKEAMRKFCSSALADLLVEAGEATPQQMGGEKEGDKWIVVPAADFDTMKRDIYEAMVLKGDPMQPAQTETQWLEEVQRKQLEHWISSCIVGKNVTLFQSEQALSMLRSVARASPELLARIYTLPVFIGAKGATCKTDHPLFLICEWDMTADAFLLALPEQLARVRPAKSQRAHSLQLMLTGCDHVSAAAQWVGVALSRALLLGDPFVALDALMTLHQSDMGERLLRGCHVRLSVGAAPRTQVGRELFVSVDGSKCADVSVTMALNRPWRPSLRACVLLNKARLTAQLENALAEMATCFPAVSSVVLVNAARYSVSSKLQGVKRLSELLEALLGNRKANDGASKYSRANVGVFPDSLPRIAVRLGSRRDVTFVTDTSTLYLPLDFDTAQVATKLRQ